MEFFQSSGIRCFVIILLNSLVSSLVTSTTPYFSKSGGIPQAPAAFLLSIALFALSTSVSFINIISSLSTSL